MIKHVVVNIKVQPNPMAKELDTVHMRRLLPNLIQSLSFIGIAPRSYDAFLGMFHLAAEVDHIVDMKNMDKYYIEYKEVDDYQYNAAVFPSIDGTAMYYVTTPIAIKMVEATLSLGAVTALHEITVLLNEKKRNSHTILAFIQRLTSLITRFDIEEDRAVHYAASLLGFEYGDIVTDEINHIDTVHNKIKRLSNQ